MASMVRLRNFGIVLILMVIFILAYFAVEASHNPNGQAHNGYINDEKQNQEALGRPSSWNPVTLFTLGLVIVAAIQAGLFIEQLRFIRISSNDTAKAANAAKDSADAAVRQAEVARKTLSASLRPWVKVGLTPASNLSWFEGKGRITILVEITNVGNVPALGVDVEIEPRCIMHGDIPAEQIAFADRFRRKSNIGFTVFPGDSTHQLQNLEISTQQLERGRDWWRGKGLVRDTVFITLIGCVTYWFAVDEDIKQTGIIYKVQKRPGTDPSYDISPSRGDVATDNLILKRWVQEGRTY